MSSRSHQHLGFEKSRAITPLNIKDLTSHLNEVQLLKRDLATQIFTLIETKLDLGHPRELTSVTGDKQLDRTCNGGGVSIMCETLSSTNFVLMSSRMTWNSLVFRFNNLKASHFCRFVQATQ